MKQIIFNKIRIQFLTEDIIRIEKKYDGSFCDAETFFIPNRNLSDVDVQCKVQGTSVTFGDYTIRIPDDNSINDISLEKNEKTIYVYSAMRNSGELPPLGKAPEVFALSDSPRILVPQGGYSSRKKGVFKVQDNVKDVYLLLCQNSDKKLRRLYVQLTGRTEFVRLASLGGWNSKYYPYNEAEAKQVILDYEKCGVPLDNLVIDTDWRSCENGWGYDINTKLFPNLKRFLRFAHKHNVEVMFNDHPEPFDGKHVFNSKEIAYREKHLQALHKLGVDTWWYDRNWNTSLISPTANVRHETLGMYLFQEITKHYYQKVAQRTDIYRRPVIMGNVVNVINGSYVQITDSASHRYSIQWTGDIYSCMGDLQREIETLIKAGNNCVAYVNGDCGGHTGNPTKEEFVRWMQFGTLSPIFRPHCACDVERFREPWRYDDETLDIVREYNLLRYRLLPLIYYGAYNSYENGEPFFKALGWEYPTDVRAVKNTREYMLGKNILIRPICGKAQIRVPQSWYVSPVSVTYFNGTDCQGEPIATEQKNDIRMSIFGTSPANNVPVFQYSARYETTVQPKKDVELFVRYDDSATVYIDGKKVLEDARFHPPVTASCGILQGNTPHKIVIDYAQNYSGAELSLYYSDVTEEKIETYLPAGKWMDLFDGKIYQGERSVSKRYSLRSMPLFVRLGAIVPLAQNAQNTASQLWNNLTLDYYPCKTACDNGVIYEDDTQTTAYQFGQFRTTNYNVNYNPAQNCFVLTLDKAIGSFEGERCFDSRNITLKIHLIDGLDVTAVTVNDCPVVLNKHCKNSAFPLNVTDCSADSDTATCSFATSVTQTYQIKIFVK